MSSAWSSKWWPGPGAANDDLQPSRASTMLHIRLSGPRLDGGNLRFLIRLPTSKREVLRFSVYHLLQVDNPLEAIPIRFETMDCRVEATEWREAADIASVIRSKNAGPAS